MVERQRVYYNPVQLECQWVGANVSVMVCGRRTGKTEGMAAPFVLKMITRMPGSTGGIVVPTFLHGLTNTVPGMLAALERLGYREGVHYVIGRKPPEWWGQPIIKPTSWKHVVAFVNGSVAVLLSQDRAYSANSLTLSWLLVDEAKFIDFAKLKEQTIPANGGNKHFFGKRSMNHAMMILSDMPQGKRGSWFLNYREEMDIRVIEGIKGQLHEHWRLRRRISEAAEKGEVVPDHVRKSLRRVDRDLNRLRSVAVFYRECSSVENIEIIGERYIRQMKRDLTPLTFRTSILCERIGTTPDGFYSNLGDEHLYEAGDMSWIDDAWEDVIRGRGNGRDAETTLLERGGFGKDFFGVPAPSTSDVDADVDVNLPLCIGMDYNANINTLVAGQPRGRRLNVVKAMYVKYERKIIELVKDFCQYYRNHRNKTVIYYYDSTALGQNFFVNDVDVRLLVIRTFEEEGWECRDVYIGSPMRHDEKYRMINLGLTHHNNLTPYFNRTNAAELVLAMQAAGVERGRLGFRKDKSGEKGRETEEDRLELRTDITDAFDTLYIGCERFAQSDFLGMGTGSVFMPVGI